ncbi:MAG: hypothetical protein M1820_001284 [Bogoriella megaspora]|nr:MAG: hypothetical protein M1820_001284 [Bogoriella megaspora]
MSSKPVALILGAGKNIGAALANRFSKNGYSLALASRSVSNPTPDGHLGISVDLSKPSSASAIFTTLRKEFGSAPTVIIYNAGSLTPPPNPENPLSLPLENFEKDLTVMNFTPYAIAQEAVRQWESEGIKGTFIYTGNILNTRVLPVPMMMGLGTGKSAAAYWVGVADSALKSKGLRFFYADERKPDGGPMGSVPGAEAAAEFYSQLASGADEIPWHATFTAGEGYKKF